ncbi:MAG: hypothetical protein ACYC6G_13990 [Desulfobaccales bacterium]
MTKLPPPSLPPEPPSGVTRAQIKEAVMDLVIASASRIGRHLNFIGQDEISRVCAELEAMAATGEIEKSWINGQALFSIKEQS